MATKRKLYHFDPFSGPRIDARAISRELTKRERESYSEPIHVITETRKEYEERKRQEIRRQADAGIFLIFTLLIAVSLYSLYSGFTTHNIIAIGLGFLMIFVLMLIAGVMVSHLPIIKLGLVGLCISSFMLGVASYDLGFMGVGILGICIALYFYKRSVVSWIKGPFGALSLIILTVMLAALFGFSKWPLYVPLGIIVLGLITVSYLLYRSFSSLFAPHILKAIEAIKSQKTKSHKRKRRKR